MLSTTFFLYFVTTQLGVLWYVGYLFLADLDIVHKCSREYIYIYIYIVVHKANRPVIKRKDAAITCN